ncbi:ATP-binding protein [Haloplanus salilacus]|uniref:ATP-binding protein n=1 Tax=Haloplanus salilacus TaxID=2949994 RepID=UPI0030CEA78D
MSQQERQGEELIPHRRREDFDYAVPADVPPFHDTGQLERVKAVVRNARGAEKLPRFWFTGPTGCGKTTAVRRLAEDLDAPLFTVQGLYDIRETDLLGSPTMLDGTVYWQDGPVTRALRSSQQRRTVLLFDEVNRARPEAKGILFPILDGRARVHTGRGNEIVEADPYNLVVVVTTNEGPDYFVEQLDLAEQRRYGSKFEMSYLAQSDFEAAVELVTNRTEAPGPLVRVVLTTVNEVRDTAARSGSSVERGVPTALVLEWLKTARVYDDEGIEEPMMTAFRDALLRPFYDEPDAVSTVASTVKSYVQGAPLGEDAAREWVASDLAGRVSGDERSTLVENVLAGSAIDEDDI